MSAQVEAAVRDFIAGNFFFQDGGDAVATDDSLLAAGVIDSTGVLELVTFLESSFGIRVADEDIVPDNLDSVGRITAYVKRKLAADPNEVGLSYAC
jgi:acyl carrier protein